MRLWMRGLVSCAPILAILAACQDDDPIPPGPKGAFQIWGQALPAEGSALRGFDRIDLEAQRVDVEVDTGEGRQRYTTVPEPFALSVFPELGPTFVLQFEAPVGEVARVILVDPRATVTYPSGARVPMSFADDELVFAPESSARWLVGEDKYSAGLVVFDPLADLDFVGKHPLDPGARFIAAAPIDGPSYDISVTTTGIIAGHGMVQVQPGTPRAKIDAINEELGATVVDVSRDQTRFLLELPYSVSVRGAAERYAQEPTFVAGALLGVHRQTILDKPGRGEIWPNDGDPGNQDGDGDPATGTQVAYFFSEVAKAWRRIDLADDGKINASVGKLPGGRRLRVAVIDAGFQLDHPDLVANLAINHGEIPAAMAASVVDHDGRPEVISFVDLNHPDNVCTQAEGPCPCYSDLNPNAYGTPGNTWSWMTFMVDICDPVDLFMDTRWSDELDQDDNGFADDIVGYALGSEENQESYDGHHWEAFHGTGVLGIIGAFADNRPGGLNADIMRFGDDTLPDVNPGQAGLLWHVDLLPIGVNANKDGEDIPNHWPGAEDSGDEGGGPPPIDDGFIDFDVYEALDYAVAMKADIIVASLGSEFVRRDYWLAASANFGTSIANPKSVLGGPDCKQSRIHTLDVDEKTFTAMMAGGKAWWGSVDLGGSVFFVAAGNCHLDADEADYERPLAEYVMPSQTVSVAAMEAFTTAEPPLHLSPAVAPWTTYGESVDLATMTDIFSLRDLSKSAWDFNGTSAATPHAAGVFGLFLLSQVLADPEYLETHTAADALPAFMAVALDPQRPTPTIGDGARFVNANLAVEALP